MRVEVIRVAEIKIEVSEIDNAITRLQGLQSRCESRKTAPPVTVGGGKTVNELEEIANVYETLNSHLNDLISNTISFLQNVSDSYISSDVNAASTIVS